MFKTWVPKIKRKSNEYILFYFSMRLKHAMIHRKQTCFEGGVAGTKSGG